MFCLVGRCVFYTCTGKKSKIFTRSWGHYGLPAVSLSFRISKNAFVKKGRISLISISDKLLTYVGVDLA